MFYLPAATTRDTSFKSTFKFNKSQMEFSQRHSRFNFPIMQTTWMERRCGLSIIFLLKIEGSSSFKFRSDTTVWLFCEWSSGNFRHHDSAWLYGKTQKRMKNEMGTSNFWCFYRNWRLVQVHHIGCTRIWVVSLKLCSNANNWLNFQLTTFYRGTAQSRHMVAK